MLSIAQTVRGDSLINYEFVALRQRGERLAYEAHPSGQSGATFFSIALTDSSVTFENVENDFPTRLGYTRRGADSVIAWISGPSGGTTRRVDYPYRRVACEPHR